MRDRILVVGQMPPLGRDLDLVARPRELQALTEALSTHGFRRNEKPLQGPRVWTQQWVRLDGCSCDSVDLVPSERWGLPRHEEERFFSEGWPIDGFEWLWHPSPHHSLLLLARRLKGGHFALSPKRREQIAQAVARDPDAWARAAERAALWQSERALAGLEAAYRTGGPVARRHCVAIAGEGVVAAFRQEGVIGVMSRSLRAVRRPGVAVVSFSGLDGAGKSTQVRVLAQTIEKLGGQVAIEWMPLGHNPSLGPIRAVVKRALHRVGHLGFSGEVAEPSVVREEPILDPGKALRQQNAGVTEAWTLVVALTTALHHRRAALGRLLHGGVIIFDRYVLDAAAQMHYFYGDDRRFRLQRWLLEAISPTPRCAFFLDVPPETVLERKHLQYSPQQLEKQYRHFKRLAEALGVRRIHGDRSQGELCEQIASEVVDALAH